jgi:uncharacterized cupin superfamily protein
MHLHLVGSGKLATAVRDACEAKRVACSAWREDDAPQAGSVLLHAGSGRQLAAALAWASKHHVPFIEASTGQDAQLPRGPDFPLVLAPNLAPQVVAFMEEVVPGARALRALGMQGEITESHQAAKSSLAGTAHQIATTLGLAAQDIRSVREQKHVHASHEVAFTDAATRVEIRLSVRVDGMDAYGVGAVRLARDLSSRSLANRIHTLAELGGGVSEPNGQEDGPGDRPDFIAHWRALEGPDDHHYSGDDELLSIGAPLAERLGLTRIGIHHERLPPGRRTSFPHAESAEEEFVYVLEGAPDAWIDGRLYRLRPGDAVGFPAGTGIAHTFLNNTEAQVSLLVVGEKPKPQNRIVYPRNPERRPLRADWWEDPPERPMGDHDGLLDKVRARKAGKGSAD